MKYLQRDSNGNLINTLVDDFKELTIEGDFTDMKRRNLYIHTESIENGYIVRDLTKTKAGYEEEPKAYIASDKKNLETIISALIDEHLLIDAKAEVGNLGIKYRPGGEVCDE